jgi:hypothetical protein
MEKASIIGSALRKKLGKSDFHPPKKHKASAYAAACSQLVFDWSD